MDLLDGLLAQHAALDCSQGEHGRCLLVGLPFGLARREDGGSSSLLSAGWLPVRFLQRGSKVLRESLWRYLSELLVGTCALLAVQGVV